MNRLDYIWAYVSLRMNACRMCDPNLLDKNAFDTAKFIVLGAASKFGDFVPHFVIARNELGVFELLRVTRSGLAHSSSDTSFHALYSKAIDDCKAVIEASNMALRRISAPTLTIVSVTC